MKKRNLAVTIAAVATTVAVFFGMASKKQVEQTTPDISGLYAESAIVVDLDYDKDVVTFANKQGFTWKYSGCEDWGIGDVADMVMWDKGTTNIIDDMILLAHSSGDVWDSVQYAAVSYLIEGNGNPYTSMKPYDLHAKSAAVVAVETHADDTDDRVKVLDADGRLWSFWMAKDKGYKIGDGFDLLVWDKGTEDITDDELYDWKPTNCEDFELLEHVWKDVLGQK